MSFETWIVYGLWRNYGSEISLKMEMKVWSLNGKYIESEGDCIELNFNNIELVCKWKAWHLKDSCIELVWHFAQLEIGWLMAHDKIKWKEMTLI